jgi:hypothetical protein
MAETIRPIFPGNAVAPLQSYGMPTADFVKNNRATGDPRDRAHQGLVFCPGWLAVKKVAFTNVDGAPTTSFDFTIPSPDQRNDGPPRADILSLLVPTGSRLYRIGFRTIPAGVEPSSSSSGPRDTPPAVTAITGTTGQKLVFGSAVPATAGPGAIAADSAHTGTDGTAMVIGAGGAVPVAQGSVTVNIGSAVPLTADLTFKLFSVAADGIAAGAGISSTIRGGAHIVAEVCYLIPEAIAELNQLNLGGTIYGGTRG